MDAEYIFLVETSTPCASIPYLPGSRCQVFGEHNMSMSHCTTPVAESMNIEFIFPYVAVPVCSAVAASAAAGGRGRSIGNYEGRESTGIAIKPPHLTWETAWIVLGWRK